MRRLILTSLLLATGTASAESAEKPWFIAPRIGVQRIVVDERNANELGGRLEAAAGVHYRELELSAFYAYSKIDDPADDSRSWLGARLVAYPRRWVFAGLGAVHNWRHKGATPAERNTLEFILGVVIARNNGARLDVLLTGGRFEQLAERQTSFEFFPAIHTTHIALMVGGQI